ncbi:hypothetical protein CLF_101835, partial [Clonorchis sinensis]
MTHRLRYQSGIHPTIMLDDLAQFSVSFEGAAKRVRVLSHIRCKCTPCEIVTPIPGPTSNIQVDTVGNAPQVTAKWSYEDACDVVEFSVNVYDSSKNSLKSLQTPNKSVDIPDLPQCVNLTVGVQGRNALGLGLETKGSEFSILA